MILVDSSVWIDHLRADDPRLDALLLEKAVVIHPFILGEVAMGSIANRDAVLADLADLPETMIAEDREVLALVRGNRLYGTGVGYLDAHLIASAKLSDVKIWTKDRRFDAALKSLGLSAQLPEH